MAASNYPHDNFGANSEMKVNPNPILGEKYEYYRSKLGTGKIYDLESQLLRGTMAFSPDRLRELDPSYQGYTHVFVLRTPPVLNLPASGSTGQVTNFDRGDIVNDNTIGKWNTNDSVGQRDVYLKRFGANTGTDKAEHIVKNLKTLFEMGCTSYSGTPNLTLNTAQVNVGWNDRQYYAPTFSEYDSTSFTMNVLETRGDPLRKGIEYYISALSDPSVKAALLNGALEDGRLIAPTLPNFTWTFMMVQTDQSLLNIQDISVWTSVIITQIDRSNLDWDNGTVDIVQPRSIQCQGNYLPDSENPAMYQIASKLLHRRMRYYRRFSDMTSKWMGMQTWDDNVKSLFGGGDDSIEHFDAHIDNPSVAYTVPVSTDTNSQSASSRSRR